MGYGCQLIQGSDEFIEVSQSNQTIDQQHPMESEKDLKPMNEDSSNKTVEKIGWV